MTSPIGSPVRLHPETAQCLNLDVAKIFVKVDLAKDLPKKMMFNIQGEEVLVEYIYPRFPTKCSICNTWGHAPKTCPRGKENQEVEQEGLEEGETKEKENDDVVEVQKIKEVEQKKIDEERMISGVLSEVESNQEEVVGTKGDKMILQVESNT